MVPSAGQYWRQRRGCIWAKITSFKSAHWITKRPMPIYGKIPNIGADNRSTPRGNHCIFFVSFDLISQIFAGHQTHRLFGGKVMSGHLSVVSRNEWTAQTHEWCRRAIANCCRVSGIRGQLTLLTVKPQPIKSKVRGKVVVRKLNLKVNDATIKVSWDKTHPMTIRVSSYFFSTNDFLFTVRSLWSGLLRGVLHLIFCDKICCMLKTYVGDQWTNRYWFTGYLYGS